MGQRGREGRKGFVVLPHTLQCDRLTIVCLQDEIYVLAMSPYPANRVEWSDLHWGQMIHLDELGQQKNNSSDPVISIYTWS